MMRVLFDFQAFDMQSHGGVSRCFAELYKHLPASVDAKFGIYETENVYLQDMGFHPAGYTYEHFLSKRNFPLKWELYKAYYNIKLGHPGRWNHKPMLNEFESETLLEQGDFDVFHPTFFFSYFLEHLHGKPFVLTIHDMIPELYPQYFTANNDQIVNRRLLVPLAAHIIAVSEQTKKDVMRLLNVPEEKITVIYHGADTMPYVPSADADKGFEYILFVGERHTYKNFMPFCEAVIPVLKRHPNLKVVCTGHPFSRDELAYFERYGLADRFVHQFMKSNQAFMDLYHHAVAFVYPSDYEGFGIPILEAYKADCPVMLNRTSCFPEIAGDAAIYFQMGQGGSDFEEQFEALYQMTGDEREALLAIQRERLKLYSWDDAAQKLADVYQKVVSTNDL